MIVTLVHAQDEEPNDMAVNIGIGIGMDYGGIGMRGTFVPVKRLGLFVSAGYNLNSVGVNTGAQLLFPKNRHAFYLTAMYGYNAVIIALEPVEQKATYYGITAGAGFLFKVGSKGNFWNFELLVPFRNSNFYDDFDTLERVGIDLTEPLPLAFSVGYHFSVHNGL